MILSYILWLAKHSFRLCFFIENYYIYNLYLMAWILPLGSTWFAPVVLCKGRGFSWKGKFVTSFVLYLLFWDGREGASSIFNSKLCCMFWISAESTYWSIHSYKLQAISITRGSPWRDGVKVGSKVTFYLTTI